MRISPLTRLGLIFLILGAVLLFSIWTSPVVQYSKAGIGTVDPGETFAYGLSIDILVIIKILITCCIGIIGVAAGLSSYLIRRMGWPERILAIASGVFMVSHVLWANGIGIVILLAVYFYQKAMNKKDAAKAAAVA
jgi:TRAP-type uncharacterized transport system fused permease subunit